TFVHFLAPTPHPSAPPFPYTTLFRSLPAGVGVGRIARNPKLHFQSFAARRPRARSSTRSSGSSSPIDSRIVPGPMPASASAASRSEEHTSELQSRFDLVCRLLLE